MIFCTASLTSLSSDLESINNVKTLVTLLMIFKLNYQWIRHLYYLIWRPRSSKLIVSMEFHLIIKTESWLLLMRTTFAFCGTWMKLNCGLNSLYNRRELIFAGIEMKRTRWNLIGFLCQYFRYSYFNVFYLGFCSLWLEKSQELSESSTSIR